MKRQHYEAELIDLAASLGDRDREKFIGVVQAETQNPLVNYGWNVWLGFFGVDRFLVGDIFAGFLKLITLGGLGIWVIVDCFLIGNRTREKNIEKVRIIYETIQNRNGLRV